MQRFAFKMKLKPGFEAEYKKRHDEVWPELAQLLKDAGISDYGIYLDEETGILFAIQKLDGSSSQDLGSSEVLQRWWKYMADLMDVNPDYSPVSVPLKEVFYMA